MKKPITLRQAQSVRNNLQLMAWRDPRNHVMYQMQLDRFNREIKTGVRPIASI